MTDTPSAPASQDNALRRFVEFAPVAIAMLDCEMRYVVASRRWILDYGLGEVDLVGRGHYEVFPELPDTWRAVHQRALAGQVVSNDEDHFRREDGTDHWLRWEVQPWRHDDGSVGGIIIFSEDITARKLAERAQQHGEARMRSVVDALAESIVFFDATGRVVDVNPAARARGFDASHFDDPTTDPRPRLLRTDGSPMPPDEQPAMVALRTGQPVRNVELGVRQADGSVQWRLVNTQPVVEADGTLVGAVVSAFDITARRRTEEALKESEARLRLVLDASQAGIWLLDVDTGGVVWDARSNELYGFPAEGRRTMDDVKGRIHEEDRGHVLAEVDHVVRTPGSAWNHEFRVVHPDGRIVWLSSIGRADRDPSGRAVRLVGINLDVTARKQTEAGLHASHAALRAQTEEMAVQAAKLRELASALVLAEQQARERLARTLHDHLQQLLFGAALKLDRLGKRLGAAPGGERELLERARADLDEAMASARSVSIELFPTVLRDRGLPAALVWLAEWKREKYGLDVEVHVDDAADPARQDVRTLLFESVRELLFNVVKHAGVARARLDLSVHGDAVRIVVSDQGNGLPGQPRLTGGGPTGLGLLGVRERLILMGGTFAITRAPGAGTRVTLEAPLTAEASAPRAGTGHGVGPARRVRVLIADDHAGVREGLRELLAERDELEVVGEASDGQEAVHLARALRPDVVIMDVSMPRLDGIAATRLLTAEVPDVVVFGLSTQERASAPHPIEVAGAAAYFDKRHDTSQLVERLVALRASRRS